MENMQHPPHNSVKRIRNQSDQTSSYCLLTVRRGESCYSHRAPPSCFCRVSRNFCFHEAPKGGHPFLFLPVALRSFGLPSAGSLLSSGRYCSGAFNTQGPSPHRGPSMWLVSQARPPIILTEEYHHGRWPMGLGHPFLVIVLY